MLASSSPVQRMNAAPPQHGGLLEERGGRLGATQKGARSPVFALSSDARCASHAVLRTAAGHLLSCTSPACGAVESFALALLLYFLTIGILGSYLLTRLFLRQALDNAAHLA
jgi:hypothetical protein